MAQMNLETQQNSFGGEQAQQLTKAITTAWRRGRVDAVIQSTDKNFMVPVGGAGMVQPFRLTPIISTHEATSTRPQGRAEQP